MRYCCFLLLLLLLPAAHQAQLRERFRVMPYGVDQGLLQSTLTDFEFDERGFCWISFPNGLQCFDGVKFRDIPVQPGLPDDKFVRFFRTSRGVLLVSHSAGISRYAGNSHRFYTVYVSPVTGSGIRFLGEEDNRVYFISSAGVLSYMDTRNYSIGPQISTGLDATLPEARQICYSNLRDAHFSVIYRDRIYRWSLREHRLTDSSEVIPRISYYFLHAETDGSALYTRYDRTKSILRYHYATRQHQQIDYPGKDNEVIGRCQVLSWGNRHLISFNHRLYATDNNQGRLISEFRGLDGAPAGGVFTICALKSDPYGNCWMQTVTGGLRKLSLPRYPTRLYSIDSVNGSNVLSVYADKNENRILAGTAGNGLLIFDTLQFLRFHIRELPGQPGAFTCNLVTRIPGGDYLLMSTGLRNLWRLGSDCRTLTPVTVVSMMPPEKSYSGYFANLVYADPQTVILQSQDRICKYYPEKQFAYLTSFSDEYIMSGCWDPPYVLSHGGNQLLWLDTAGFQQQKALSLPGTGYVRCFARDISGRIVAGSNKGIFYLAGDGKRLRQLTRASGLPDECIYAMAAAPDGKLWCSSNRGIFSIDPAGKVERIQAADGLQGNEFNTNAVYVAADGELFFGGVNGISSFFPAQIRSAGETPSLWLTAIISNNRLLYPDTAHELIQSIDLPYERQSLSFSFTLTGHGSSADYQCQYRMQGIDSAWIPGNPQQMIHYFLPPGNYELQLSAGPVFDPEAVPLRVLQITIRPPFWKTWWFGALAGLGLLAVIIGGIQLYYRRRYLRKLQDVEARQKVLEERERISRELHDSVGAYANAVLYNAELLQQHDAGSNEPLIRGLKGLSKDIITSLRDNVWALKSAAFTAEECLLRIRNFTQSLNRYYYDTAFSVEGDAPELILDSTHALHLIRIVQEALTNAVRHAAAGNIRVQSSQENDRWKLCISDDGKGFETPESGAGTDSNGLANMRNRAAEAGFGFSVDSVAGSGTRICILV